MTLEEAQEIVSYGVGYKLGGQLQEDPMLVKDTVLKGINAALTGEGDAPDQAKFQEAGTLIQEEQTREAREGGEKFLAENKEKEGVQVTASGLQYIVNEEGEGDSPKASDNVTVHYEGRLIDGTVFDSSMKRGKPATFGVSQVITGWVEGLQLMKPGAKYQFFIPQDLAYGERGSGGSIPPFSALVFDVELISIA